MEVSVKFTFCPLIFQCPSRLDRYGRLSERQRFDHGGRHCQYCGHYVLGSTRPLAGEFFFMLPITLHVILPVPGGVPLSCQFFNF